MSEYPSFQPWELNYIQAFLSFEKRNGRVTKIYSEDKQVVDFVQSKMDKLDGTEYIPPIEESIERFVYHATDCRAAKSIFSSGKLLSATRVLGKTGDQIVKEKRELNSGWIDLPDFYEYIMFGWGTHLVGDYVVLSTHWPSDEDFSRGNFDAGIRLYFEYQKLLMHSNHVFDGYHVLKVKDEIDLSEYLFVCIVPEQFRTEIEPFIQNGIRR